MSFSHFPFLLPTSPCPAVNACFWTPEIDESLTQHKLTCCRRSPVGLSLVRGQTSIRGPSVSLFFFVASPLLSCCSSASSPGPTLRDFPLPSTKLPKVVCPLTE